MKTLTILTTSAILLSTTVAMPALGATSSVRPKAHFGVIAKPRAGLRLSIQPQRQNGAMDECLKAAAEQGMGPNSARHACIELVLGDDGMEGEHDEDTSD